MTRRHPMFPQRQQGVVLAIVLILLLVMTLLAIASLRGTLMEERMSAAQFDRGLGFQAAEAALREAEEWAETKPAPPGSSCLAGICATPDPEATPYWMDETLWPAQWREATVEVGGLTAAPRYLVEFMADDVEDATTCTTSIDVSPDAKCSVISSRYRITVRSQDDGRAEVMLQSIYLVP